MQESFTPQSRSTDDTRAEERKRLAQEAREEGALAKISRLAKETIQNPESYIGERDTALFRAAGYSKSEIKWIAEVKKSSRPKASTDYNADLNAYDLVRAQAMLARALHKSKEFDEFGKVEYDERTDRYLHEILSKMAGRYERWAGPLYDECRAKVLEGAITSEKSTAEAVKEAMISVQTTKFGRMGIEERRYFRQTIDCYVRYKTCSDPIEIARLFTDWLGVMHMGGNLEALGNFYGVPSEIYGKEFSAAFLYRLNELGRGMPHDEQVDK